MAWNEETLKVVVKNTALIEDAWEALEDANDQLIEQMWAYIGRLCEEQGNFAVEEDRNGDHHLFESAWTPKKDGTPIAAFWLDGQGESFDDKTWTSILCGLIPGTMAGLYFWYDWSDRNIRRKDWKNFLKDFFSTNPSLFEAGFSLNGDGTAIMIPLRFELSCLAENFGNLDDCFEPLNEALEAIFKQREVFGNLIRKAAKLEA